MSSETVNRLWLIAFGCAPLCGLFMYFWVEEVVPYGVGAFLFVTAFVCSVMCGWIADDMQTARQIAENKQPQVNQPRSRRY